MRMIGLVVHGTVKLTHVEIIFVGKTEGSLVIHRDLSVTNHVTAVLCRLDLGKAEHQKGGIVRNVNKILIHGHTAAVSLEGIPLPVHWDHTLGVTTLHILVVKVDVLPIVAREHEGRALGIHRGKSLGNVAVVNSGDLEFLFPLSEEVRIDGILAQEEGEPNQEDQRKK